MKYQLLPPLTVDEYESLKTSIAEMGVLVPIVVDENGEVLDGHHRLQACTELGIDCPREVRTGLTEGEKRSHARQMNLLRRQLSRAARRALIADELTENPNLSNLTIAQRLGVSDTTVGKIRRQLGLTDAIVGADGKTYQSVRRDELGERLEYTIVFRDRDSYMRFMNLVREAKRGAPGEFIADTIAQLVQHGIDSVRAVNEAEKIVADPLLIESLYQPQRARKA